MRPRRSATVVVVTAAKSIRLIVPAGIRDLVIAELETERTTIEEIRVNEARRISLVNLERGDVLWIPVEPGDVVDLRGYYTAVGEAAPDPWLRNCIVSEFMSAGLTSSDVYCRNPKRTSPRGAPA